jgi:tetraacyldisaccharide 4'-kinase
MAAVLFPATVLYYFGVRTRHLLYDVGFLKSYQPEIFTVSIGNITAGGTGKTPTVISLARELVSKNIKTLVLTRGYGRNSSGRVVVEKGTPVKKTGDEPMEIFKNTGCFVVCDKDRTSSLKDLSSGFSIAILDDGFQHRKVKRNLDIVLVDESRFMGNGLLLPSGILRDIPDRLKFCDIIILTKIKDLKSDSAEQKTCYLKKYGKKLLLSMLKYDSIKNGRNELELKKLSGMKLSLFCGIADPSDFFGIFDGLNVAEKKSFTDHFDYSDAEGVLKSIKKDSDIMITTQKDFVKLNNEIIEAFNIYYLDSGFVFFDTDMKEVCLYDIIAEHGFEK